MTSTQVGITTKLPHRPHRSANDYRRALSEQLFSAMLNARLDEIRRQPNAPFLMGFSSSGPMVRQADSFRQSASVKEDGVEQGLSALLEELLRVERHGFTATELDRAKRQTLRTYEQHVKERDKRDAKTFTSEIVRNFLQGESMPGPEVELSLVQKFLPSFTLEELNGLGKSLAVGSRVITVSGPPKMVKPSQEAVLALAKSVAARDIRPYEDAGPSEPLMAQAPTPGAVVKTTTIPEIGVTEWTLKNGVKVVVKPTTFSNDEVKMTAFSPGGHSLASDADFDTAKSADAIVNQGGLGPFDAVKLRKSLAGKVASVSPSIRELDEALSGSASPSDLDLMFQMIHLTFTGPRRDEKAFAAWRAREIESAKNRRLSPEMSFAEDMALFSTQNHPRRRWPTVDSLQKLDLDKAMATYKDRFGDAGDFTFVFVGNIDTDKLKTLAETYLGSLPTKGRKETWRDPKVSRPSGVQTKTVVKGTEPKSQVTLTFHGAEKWTRETDNDMRMLNEVLGMRLREVLREDMGGVYGVRVSGNISRRPKQEFSLTVSFGCAPENVEKLQKAVFDEARTIQEKGIGDDYIAKVKELRRRTHEVNLKENAFWLRELERAYMYGDDPKQIPDVTPLIDKVTSDRVKAAATKYVTPKQYILGVLKPEAAAAPATK
jgi:zinc protease